MDLGNFSVSLAVKDIEASKLFYEKLGFVVFGGDQSQNWLILKRRFFHIRGRVFRMSSLLRLKRMVFLAAIFLRFFQFLKKI